MIGLDFISSGGGEMMLLTNKDLLLCTGVDSEEIHITVLLAMRGYQRQRSILRGLPVFPSFIYNNTVHSAVLW